MQVPKMGHNFRANKTSGNLKIRKEYGGDGNRYAISVGEGRLMYLSQEDMDRLGEYIKENSEAE